MMIKMMMMININMMMIKNKRPTVPEMEVIGDLCTYVFQRTMMTMSGRKSIEHAKWTKLICVKLFRDTYLFICDDDELHNINGLLA